MALVCVNVCGAVGHRHRQHSPIPTPISYFPSSCIFKVEAACLLRIISSSFHFCELWLHKQQHCISDSTPTSNPSTNLTEDEMVERRKAFKSTYEYGNKIYSLSLVAFLRSLSWFYYIVIVSFGCRCVSLIRVSFFYLSASSQFYVQL